MFLSVLMAAGVFLSYVFGAAYQLTEEELSTLAMVAVTVPEICLLIRISIPFDPLRGILLGCVIGGLLVGSSLFSSILSLADLSWELMGHMLAMTLISAAVFNILYTFIEKRRARITQKLASKSGDPNKKKRRDSYTLEAYIGMGIRKAAAWIKNRNKAANHKSKEREKS